MIPVSKQVGLIAEMAIAFQTEAAYRSGAIVAARGSSGCLSKLSSWQLEDTWLSRIRLHWHYDCRLHYYGAGVGAGRNGRFTMEKFYWGSRRFNRLNDILESELMNKTLWSCRRHEVV